MDSAIAMQVAGLKFKFFYPKGRSSLKSDGSK